MLQKIFAICQERLARPRITTVHSTSLALEFRRHTAAPLWPPFQKMLALWRAPTAATPLPENFYPTLMRNASAGLFVVNRALQFVEVNDSFCRMWGMSRKEILTQTLPEILAGAECEPDFFSDLLACRAGRGELKITAEARAARFFELETTALPQEFFLGLAYDITERKQREEELRRAAEWRALLLRSLSEGLGIIDREGRILLCNRAFETALGLSGQALQEVSLLKPYWQTPQRECLWSLCDMRGTPWFGAENPFYRAVQLQQRVSDCRVQIQPRDKTLSVAATPLHDEHNNLLGAVVTLRDVSAQFRLEQEKENTRLAQQQSACFAAQRALARDVAPLIEDPSCGIALYAQMLLHSLPATSEEAVLARGIVQETNGLLEVIRELRALAKSGNRGGTKSHLRKDRVAAQPMFETTEHLLWPFAVN